MKVFVFKRTVPCIKMQMVVDFISGKERNIARYEAGVAFEEAFMNVYMHAYEGKKKGPLVVTVDINDEKVVCTLDYLGKKFDPSKAPIPEITENMVGGHGLRLMRAYSNVSYKRMYGHNLLKLERTFK